MFRGIREIAFFEPLIYFVTNLFFQELYAFEFTVISFIVCSSVIPPLWAVSISSLLLLLVLFHLHFGLLSLFHIYFSVFPNCFKSFHSFSWLFYFTLSYGFPGTFPLSLQGTAKLTSFLRTTFFKAYILRLTFHTLS